MLVVLFAFLFGGAMTVPGGGTYIEFLMPGMFVMTMAFGVGETMVAVTQDADKGVTDRLPLDADVVGRRAPRAGRLGHALRDARASP